MSTAAGDTRYIDYFAAALAQHPGASAAERRRAVQNILARVEASLPGAAHTPAVLAAELALARAAAAGALNAASAVARPAAGAAPAERTGFRLRPQNFIWVLLPLAAYLAPLYFFFQETVEKTRPENAGTHELALEFKISAVDLGRDTITFHILPEAGALLGPDGRLLRDLTVEIDPGSKPESHTFKADTPLTPWTLSVNASNGDILEYPFDRYQVDFEVNAKSEGRDLNVMSTLNKVPHDVAAVMSEKTLANGEDSISVAVRRSGTIIFVALLATLSLLLVTFAAVAVAWQVYFHGRKADFSMMTWVAALSFVIPSVRNALPGSVPTGALIDFLLFFWLQIAAGIAMSVMVLNWIRQRVG